MTLLTETGTFTKPTSTGAQSQTINLVDSSLTPKFLILWTNGLTTTDGTYTEGVIWSYGFSDGTNDACQTMAALDNVTTQNEAYGWNNNAIISVLSLTPAQVARADVTSFNAGNFVLNWSVNTTTTATVIHYIVGGGTDITNVSVIQDTIDDTSTGNHSFSGSGTTFTPDFALIMTGTENGGGISINTLSVGADNAQFNIGAARTASERYALVGRTESIGTSDTDMALLNNACISNQSRSTGDIAFTGDFVQFDDAAGGGITINITEAVNVTPTHLAFLFIKGGAWTCGTFQQRSGTGTQDVNLANPDVAPKLVSLSGINSDTINSAVDNNYIGVGASDGTRQGCSWGGDMTGSALMVSTSANLTSQVYRQGTPNATASSSTTNAQCTMSDMTAAGKFQLSWGTADTTLRQMAYWAIGTLTATTRFYLHSTGTSVGGTLPSTEQSTLTSDKDRDPQTSNRTMDTDIGSAMVSIGLATNATTSLQNYYFTRFISPLVNQTSIPASAWTYSFAARQVTSSANFPVSGNAQPVHVHVYVWKPSNGTKVGTIIDADSASEYNEPTTLNSVTSMYGSFTGSEVTGMTAGDAVVAFEVWFRITQASATSNTVDYYWGGGTETNNNGTTVLDHASYIRAVQTIVFGEPTGTTYNRSPSADSTTVSDSSLTRLLSAARVPSADSTTVTAGTSTRMLSASRVPSADTTTVGETSLTGVKVTQYDRAPSADTSTVADSSLNRLISAVRVPGTDTSTVADSSLSRMLSATRLANVASYDDFSSGTYSFTEGGSSPNGKWVNDYLGGTGASSGVRFSSSIGSNVMWQIPQASTTEFETHASKSDSTTSYSNFDCTFRMRTVAQTRQNFTPNTWETAWVIFRYTDDWHHYYFTLKTNGPEFGRKDYFPHVEQQMFLATPGTPTCTIGQWYKVRIRAVRNHFMFWIDDSLVIDMVDDGSVGYDSQTAGLPPPPTAALYGPGTFCPYNEDAEVEFDEIVIGESDYVTVVESSLSAAKVKQGIPSADTITITESSLTRLLSANRALTPETMTVNDSSLSRSTSLARTPSTDTITASDTSTVRTKSLLRIPSTDTITIADSSLTRLLSAIRLPSTDDVIIGDNLARLLSASRSPSLDSITIEEISLDAVKSVAGIDYARTPASENITVSDSSLTRLLSALRIPSSDSSTVSDSSLTRLLSAIRLPSTDTVDISEGLSAGQTQSFDRTPATENVTVTDSSLTRLLSALRVPTEEIVSIVESSLTRMLNLFRTVATDTTTVIDSSLVRTRSLTRVPSSDSTTVTDSSLNRLLSASRVPSADTITVSDFSLTRLLQLIRVPGADTTSLSENVSALHTTTGQFNRSPTPETITIAEQSLSRMLSLIRVPSTDTTGTIGENLSKSKLISRVPAANTTTVADSSLVRRVSLSRNVSETATNVIESSLVRLLQAIRSPNAEIVSVSELEPLLSYSRSLQDTLNITEPTLEKIMTAVRTLTDSTEIEDLIFAQTWHRFVYDSVTVAEQLFIVRQALSGPVTYAIPSEVRPLLGNIGAQRTDPQIELAIDSAYDEINRKTNRTPPNDWKDTEPEFSIIKKLTRYKAALEMSIGIKDFEDRDAMQKEIDEMFKIIEEHDPGGVSSNDMVISSEDETYALNPAGLIWSTRYPNLKKSSTSGENNTTINPDT